MQASEAAAGVPCHVASTNWAENLAYLLIMLVTSRFPSRVSCCARQDHRTHCCQQGTRWPPLSEGLASIRNCSNPRVGGDRSSLGWDLRCVFFLPFGFSGTSLCMHSEATNTPVPMTLWGGVQSHHEHRTTQIRSTSYISKIRPHTLLQPLTQVTLNAEGAVMTSDIDGPSRNWEI